MNKVSKELIKDSIRYDAESMSLSSSLNYEDKDNHKSDFYRNKERLYNISPERKKIIISALQELLGNEEEDIELSKDVYKFIIGKSSGCPIIIFSMKKEQAPLHAFKNYHIDSFYHNLTIMVAKKLLEV